MTNPLPPEFEAKAMELIKICPAEHLVQGIALAEIGLGHTGGAVCNKCLAKILHSTAQSARQKALDEACTIVFGQCGSDNVAQRTVNAIRALFQSENELK